MPISAGIAAAGTIGGALIAAHPAKQTNQGTYSNTSSTTPNLMPQQTDLYNSLTQMAQNRLHLDPNLTGYQATGLSNINAGSNAVQQNIQNRLASQGLLGSPIAANAGVQQELARGGQAVQFQNSIPLLARQLQNQDIGIAGDIFRLPGVGQTTSTSGQYSGTGTFAPPGGVAGNALSGLGGSLGFLYGLGAFGQGNVTGTPTLPANPLGISPGLPQLPTLGAQTAANPGLQNILAQLSSGGYF